VKVSDDTASHNVPSVDIAALLHTHTHTHTHIGLTVSYKATARIDYSLSMFLYYIELHKNRRPLELEQ